MTNCERKVTAFTCLVLFLFLLPVSSPAQAPSEARLVRPTELPFHLSHGVAIIIRGRIGALHDLRFVLDTGTTRTIIDQRVRDQLHLSCHYGNTLINFNRNVGLEQCTLPDIEIGSFHFKNLPVNVATLARLSTFLDDADAVIGMDVLGASKFTIDYASDEVEFESMELPAPPPTKAPNDPLCMTAVIQVQGHPVRLIVDTGVRGVLLYEDRLRARVPHLRFEGKPEKVNIGGRMSAKRVTLPGVRLGKAETDSVVLLIASPRKNALPGIDGFLGVSVLKARRITFDFVDRKLTWEH